MDELRTLIKIIAITLAVVTLAFVPSTSSALSLYMRSANFVMVDGLILEKKMNTHHRNRSTSKYCGFSYKYKAKNSAYVGNRLSLDSDNNKYGIILYSLPYCPYFDKVGDTGEKVKVLYNSGHPQESIIIRSLPFRGILNVCLIFLAWTGLLIYFLKAKARLVDQSL